MWLFTGRPAADRKLAIPLTGPYTVTGQPGGTLRTIYPDGNWCKQPRAITVSLNRLKRCRGTSEPQQIVEFDLRQLEHLDGDAEGPMMNTGITNEAAVTRRTLNQRAGEATTAPDHGPSMERPPPNAINVAPHAHCSPAVAPSIVITHEAAHPPEAPRADVAAPGHAPMGQISADAEMRTLDTPESKAATVSVDRSVGTHLPSPADHSTTLLPRRPPYVSLRRLDEKTSPPSSADPLAPSLPHRQPQVRLQRLDTATELAASPYPMVSLPRLRSPPASQVSFNREVQPPLHSSVEPAPQPSTPVDKEDPPGDVPSEPASRAPEENSSLESPTPMEEGGLSADASLEHPRGDKREHSSASEADSNYSFQWRARPTERRGQQLYPKRKPNPEDSDEDMERRPLRQGRRHLRPRPHLSSLLPIEQEPDMRPEE